MNSDLIPTAKASNSRSAKKAQNSQQVATETEITPNPSLQTTLDRQQPIPPPSEPMQYRAIGLVRGSYKPSSEQYTQGTVLAPDGTELSAVLLGRIMSLLKNHLNLEQEHLWVVYPRTRQEDGYLYLQIVGVWEPENLAKNLNQEQQAEEQESQRRAKVPPVEATSVSQGELAPSMPQTTKIQEQQSQTELVTETSVEVEDGYFSIRGEVVFQSATDGYFVVKIKQAPRKEGEKPKYFKLRIQGVLPTKPVGQFWDLHVVRKNNGLALEQAEAIAALPSKPKPKRKPSLGGFSSPKRNLETPRPIPKQGNSAPIQRPIPKTSTPKPIKRQKPAE